MPADDALLFIDANKYLDLYRIDKGKELLAPLAEQVEYIFVTQQLVGEVQRNKIQVAAAFLNQKFKELKLQAFNVPDHLSSSSTEQGKDILQQMREIGQKIKKVNAAVEALGLSIIEQISSSEDEVSKALDPIFAKAALHSPEELQRARDRRELGNPPGKSNNPIGDQLTWEQILTHFKGKKRLWIISRDGDYGTVYGGKGFLNQFLYNELCKVASAPEVHLFEDLVEGISHFVDTTGVKAEKRLTPEEVEEIEKEEKSLPYVLGLNLTELFEALRASEKVPPPNAVSLPHVLGLNLTELFEALRASEKVPPLDAAMLETLRAAGTVPPLDAAMLETLRAARTVPPLDAAMLETLRAAGTVPRLNAAESTKGNQEERDEQPPTLPPSTQKEEKDD